MQKLDIYLEKVNPADALTRQVRGADVEYAGRVKKEDQD